MSQRRSDSEEKLNRRLSSTLTGVDGRSFAHLDAQFRRLLRPADDNDCLLELEPIPYDCLDVISQIPFLQTFVDETTEQCYLVSKTAFQSRILRFELLVAFAFAILTFLHARDNGFVAEVYGSLSMMGFALAVFTAHFFAITRRTPWFRSLRSRAQAAQLSELFGFAVSLTGLSVILSENPKCLHQELSPEDLRYCFFSVENWSVLLPLLVIFSLQLRPLLNLALIVLTFLATVILKVGLHGGRGVAPTTNVIIFCAPHALCHVLVVYVMERSRRSSFSSRVILEVDEIALRRLQKYAETTLEHLMPLEIILKLNDGIPVVEKVEKCVVGYTEIDNYVSWSQKHLPNTAVEVVDALFCSWDSSLHAYPLVSRVSMAGDAYVTALGFQDPCIQLPTCLNSEWLLRYNSLQYVLCRRLAKTFGIAIRTGIATGSSERVLFGQFQLRYGVAGGAYQVAKALSLQCPRDATLLDQGTVDACSVKLSLIKPSCSSLANHFQLASHLSISMSAEQHQIVQRKEPAEDSDGHRYRESLHAVQVLSTSMELGGRTLSFLAFADIEMEEEFWTSRDHEAAQGEIVTDLTCSFVLCTGIVLVAALEDVLSAQTGLCALGALLIAAGRASLRLSGYSRYPRVLLFYTVLPQAALSFAAVLGTDGRSVLNGRLIYLATTLGAAFHFANSNVPWYHTIPLLLVIEAFALAAPTIWYNVSFVLSEFAGLLLCTAAIILANVDGERDNRLLFRQETLKRTLAAVVRSHTESSEALLQKLLPRSLVSRVLRKIVSGTAPIAHEVLDAVVLTLRLADSNSTATLQRVYIDIEGALFTTQAAGAAAAAADGNDSQCSLLSIDGDRLSVGGPVSEHSALYNDASFAASRAAARKLVLLTSFFLQRDYSSRLTIVLTTGPGMVSLLGERQPTFDLIGPVANAAKELLAAAPQGYIGASDAFLRLLGPSNGTDSVGLSIEVALGATMSWHVRGVGAVPMTALVVPASAGGAVDPSRSLMADDISTVFASGTVRTSIPPAAPSAANCDDAPPGVGQNAVALVTGGV